MRDSETATMTTMSEGHEHKHKRRRRRERGSGSGGLRGEDTKLTRQVVSRLFRQLENHKAEEVETISQQQLSKQDIMRLLQQQQQQQQQQKNSIFKRKKRKSMASGVRSICWAPVISNVLLGVILVRSLLCDTTTTMASGAESPQSANSAAATETDATNSGLVNLQRFSEEPHDTLALLGRPADLACSVENKQGALIWVRDGFDLGYNKLKDEYRARYSLPHATYATNATSSPLQAAATDGTTSNWTLHIEKVHLLDDRYFSCQVLEGVDAQHRRIDSRLAKLTVLQPPARLTILAESAPDDSANQSPYAALAPVQRQQQQQLQQQQQQHNSNEPNLSAGNRSSVDDNNSELDGADDDGVQVVTVIQDERLRLECRADQAKPHAELVWLDNQQRELNASTPDSFVEQRVSVDAQEPALAVASLVWSFRAQRNHTNQVFTCKARHPAFEQPNLFPDLYGREPQRQVRLNVLYKPEIENLAKEPHTSLEAQPLKFLCVAHARPNQLTYRWYIDDQLVANATDSELVIANLTRQLHLREIKCQVSNSVGTSTVVHRLVVRYPPAFVTHLLQSQSSSVLIDAQPLADLTSAGFAGAGAGASASDDYDFQQMAKQDSRVAGSHSQVPQVQLQVQPREPTATELSLARQLAVGFRSGQDVQLRCDFDANPTVQHVAWYKVNIQQRELLKDVTPLEANELIEMGEARAIFRDLDPSATGELAEFDAGARQQQHHRHQHQQHQQQLDYKQMSEELISELDLLQSEQQQQQQYLRRYENNASSIGADVAYAVVANGTPTQHNLYIQESLQWMMRPTTTNLQLVQLTERSGGSSQLLAGKRPPPPPPGRHPQSGDRAAVNHSARQQLQLQLNLLQAVDKATSGAPQVLARREAPISSSFISFRNVNNDTMGKYICRAKSGSGAELSSTARAIYLVPNNRPRIVSAREQWAPMINDGQVQVECLAQISTNWDTAFTWSRDGKTIDSMATTVGEEKYKLIMQRSPDMLFMRSILQIQHAAPEDDGLYTCSVSNTFGPPDTMDIRLKYLMPTGFSLAVVAVIAVCTVLLLACVVSMMIICGPRPTKLDAKLAAMSHGNSNNNSSSNKISEVDASNSDDGSQASSSTSSIDRKSPQSSTMDIAHKDHGSAASICGTISNQAQYQDRANGERQSLDARLMNGGQQLLANGSIYDRCDSSDSTATHQAGIAHSQQSHKFRSSLRQQTVVGGQNRLSKYAAIQESLEHKLNLGQPLFGPPRLAAQQPKQLDNNQSAERSVDVPQQQQQQQQHRHQSPTGKTQSISELERGSLVNRLWDRLLMRAERSRVASSRGTRGVKSRPVISMPVGGLTELRHSAGSKRSSISNSLSALADGSGSANETTDKKTNTRLKSVNLNHSNKGHLLSSRAKLIQDSATGSDGTACSSSRSSSSSGHNHHDHHHQQQQQHQLQHHHNAALDYSETVNINYLPQQASMWMPTPNSTSISHELNASNNGQMADRGVYVSDLTANSTYQPIMDNNQLYTNGHLITSPAYAPQLQPQMIAPTYVPTTLNNQSQLGGGWSPEANQTTFGHYQLPMILQSEPYFAAQQQQSSVQQPCYATICTKPAQHVVQYGSTPTANVNSINNPNSGYGTLPVRPASPQCHRMVPTSDAGDTFYEDNYGTLLSSAYKTLGYANNNNISSNSNSIALPSTKLNIHAASSASSSPNSLTTNRSSNLASTIHINHNDKSLVPDGGDSNHLQLTQVQVDGTIIAANSINGNNNNNNENSQATHV